MIATYRELQIKYMLPQAYAEKLVDAYDPIKYPMFSMNALEGHPISKKSVEDENILMKWNEIVSEFFFLKKKCFII